MEGIYNNEKLMDYRPLLHGRRVLIVGCGAVGSYVAEFCAKMGFSIDCVDMDRFTIENTAKHSALIRTPEDSGRSKALATAQRVQVLLDTGCTTHGLDANVTRLGPEAYADYEYVLLALDNYDAELVVNRQLMELPQERQPKVIMAGTYGDLASSVGTDMSEFCIDCLIADDWKETGYIHTSCTGPQIPHASDGPIVQTSNTASATAAMLAVEQLRASALGLEEAKNRRITYTAFPVLEIDISKPLKKRNCPSCTITPPDIHWLEGSVLDVKLRDALDMIADELKTRDFELSVARIKLHGIDYGAFVGDEVCAACGKPIHVYRHEVRTTEEDLLCEDCKTAGRGRCGQLPHPEPLRAFTFDTEEDILNMSLYSLGFPLGAHLEVLQREEDLGLLRIGNINHTIFSFADDHEKMHTVDKLD